MDCLCILLIIPIWLGLMGVVIALRYNNKNYILSRDDIIENILKEKYLEARGKYKNFHRYNGPRHSLARMIQQSLRKSHGKEFSKKIFEFLYKDKSIT